ncbi:MAG: hypothetical protein QGH15_24045, partial [Kiritimatiellia bacterium]|nr:hypothetical protein [Kiritimatiellia bacterium]
MTKLNIAIALLAGILALMWCATPACAQGLVINEFMAINDTTLQDANSEYSDWLEIYNPGPEIIDVAGWYLTDNPGNLTKWQ